MTTPRTAAEWAALILTSIEQGQREILADMATGRVPVDCDDFAKLHDYVDANEYGGLCETGWVQYSGDDQTDDAHAAATKVQDTLHQWLQTRRVVQTAAHGFALSDVIRRAHTSLLGWNDITDAALISALPAAEMEAHRLVAFVFHVAAGTQPDVRSTAQSLIDSLTKR